MRDFTQTQVALRVEGLRVKFPGSSNRPYTVYDLDFELHRGRITGLIGESGCGKSTAAMAAIGFNRGGETVTGRASLGDLDLLDAREMQRNTPWGHRVCYVSQSAALALNPSLTIRRQMSEPLVRHMGLRGAALEHRMLELLRMVQLPAPENALGRYPFQFSGGQQQRIALAIAFACRPEVLILDEPTTGLDVTTQAQISKLLKDQVCETGVAVLYVSHDLSLLGSLADEMMVMYAGQVVERGAAQELLRSPRHPYTKMLLGLSPRLDDPRLLPGIPGVPPPGVVSGSCAFAPRCPYATEECRKQAPELSDDGHQVRCLHAEKLRHSAPEPLSLRANNDTAKELLLELKSLRLHYFGLPYPSVDGVSLKLHRGQRIGIVGESGSGKSSILKLISGLVAPTDGSMHFDGKPLTKLAQNRSAQLCAEIQLIFQNPDASLNPRHSIATLLSRSLALFRPEVPRSEYAAISQQMLERVRLPAAVLHRMPRDLSGGQRQRVAIARAFLSRPKLLLCDEVTSALDVSVQASVLQLIAELSDETGVAILFVSHDLAVVRTLCDHVVVMQNGRVVEQNSAVALFESPAEPYTRSLLGAIPRLPQQI